MYRFAEDHRSYVHDADQTLNSVIFLLYDGEEMVSSPSGSVFVDESSHPKPSKLTVNDLLNSRYVISIGFIEASLISRSRVTLPPAVLRHESKNVTDVEGELRSRSSLFRGAFSTDQNMMTSSNGKIFRITLCVEFTGPRWIRRTKAIDAELWCFLLSASE